MEKLRVFTVLSEYSQLNSIGNWKWSGLYKPPISTYFFPKNIHTLYYFSYEFKYMKFRVTKLSGVPVALVLKLLNEFKGNKFMEMN